MRLVLRPVVGLRLSHSPCRHEGSGMAAFAPAGDFRQYNQPLGRPAHEPVVKGFARSIDLRRVDPAASGLQNMNNPADNPAIINTGLAASIYGKKRLKPRKLFVIQLKTVPDHHGSPFADRESQNRR